MDKHLEVSYAFGACVLSGLTISCHQILAAKYFDTLFLKAEVSNVPFLVAKMQVQVLPCVVGFVNGQSKMKYVPRLFPASASGADDNFEQNCGIRRATWWR